MNSEHKASTASSLSDIQHDVSAGHPNDADISGSGGGGWLATQLRLAKQQRMQRQQTATGVGDSTVASGGQAGIPGSTGTLSRAVGADMMSDLQRVLAARRRAREGDTDEADGDAAATGGGTACNDTNSSTTGHYRRPSQSSNPGNHNNNSTTAAFATPVAPPQTPSAYGTIRKNSTSVTSNESLGTQAITRADLEAFKREILAEFRKEVKSLKSDILDGEFTKREHFGIPLAEIFWIGL
ncbi:hypothetical protein AAHC03_013334 [Spirometra sp. Aus1]